MCRKGRGRLVSLTWEFFTLSLQGGGFPGGASGKENLPASAGDKRDAGSIPGLGRSPGGGHGNPLQYSCLESSADVGAWRATVRGFAKSQTPLKRFSTARWGAEPFGLQYLGQHLFLRGSQPTPMVSRVGFIPGPPLHPRVAEM